MVNICPCKGCVPPVRNDHCHPTCERYLEWKRITDEEHDVIRKAKVKEGQVYSFRKDQVQKFEKSHRR